MRYALSLVLMWITFSSLAQTEDSLRVNEYADPIIITAYKDKPASRTSLNFITVRVDSLSGRGNFNLTDLLAKNPGVSMLTTGVAIAKPVIRGLYGNRVTILLSGLKFDNQQWQEEHGLGISDMGISEVELIKGPMSVLYGTEAMGGVINLIEEEKAPLGKSVHDIGFRFNSNTLGGMVQAGYKINRGTSWSRIRVMTENNADYSDGRGSRVLNSRFDGYAIKASHGFQRKNWTSNNNYFSSFNRFGFIFNDIYTFVTPDARWSRTLNVNPAHMVLLNILSSENKFILKNNSKLNVNLGVQSNERMENEGGGAISLNMHLLTLQYLLKYETDLSEKTKLVLSSLGSFEDNTNYGSRKIVPDARMQESNLSAYFETTVGKKLILENGLGMGEKRIKTFFTPTVNDPKKEIRPFTKFSTYYNAYTGLTFFPNEEFNLKFNAATGVRVANLAELSSDGLHEGIFTFEIGDPNLKNEQNFMLNVMANAKPGKWEFSISPFYNYFLNYIYLAPTNEDWFGFPVYRYKQQNARQYGTEGMMAYNVNSALKLSASYSGMISQTADGHYTPYIPAQKITPAITYNAKVSKLKSLVLYSSGDMVFAQHKVATYERGSSDYFLLNAGVSTSFRGNSKLYTISLSGNNLLNRAYYDNLSRFKNYGLLNIGTNVTLNLVIHFDN